MVFEQARARHAAEMRAHVGPGSQPQVIDAVVDIMERLAYAKGSRRRLTPLA